MNGILAHVVNVRSKKKNINCQLQCLLTGETHSHQVNTAPKESSKTTTYPITNENFYKIKTAPFAQINRRLKLK